MQAGNLPAPKLIIYCYSVLECMAKQSKLDLDVAVENVVLQKSSVKEEDFRSSLDKQALKVNEIRFYRDLLSQKITAKPLAVLMNARKVILNSKQVTNHVGLQMDKVFLTIDEWSSVVTRLFSSNSQLGQSLVKFQVNLDHLCKSNAHLKPVKENINRITLTTVLECIYMSYCTIERSYDASGKHVVEQTIPPTNSTHKQTTNLGMIG